MGKFLIITVFLRIFFYLFFEISVPNIFEIISKTVGYLSKIIKINFVASLSSFQENFQFLKSVSF